ncbi:hypothetical protein HZS_2381 [Henneguya salminicola]|nr:hypothetical protein HZS_2381 [Henneguya salminicola]
MLCHIIHILLLILISINSSPFCSMRNNNSTDTFVQCVYAHVIDTNKYLSVNIFHENTNSSKNNPLNFKAALLSAIKYELNESR